ncbi:MAG: hypothetical protein OXC60_07435 [Litoreibacter sp.]|nr:hypothetical protein [Litoreibacter sp.]MCY4334493.1 hypothetical protein [Litoreibacter sp.]
MTKAQGYRQVKRRRVFYIPGYDPFPPRRYRELYRRESAEQAAISGYEIAIGAGSEGESFGWQVRAEIDGVQVDSQIEVLVWSDIVQSSMGAGIAQSYWQLLRTAWIYVTSGALRRLMWLRKGPVIAALYPVGVLLLQLFLAVWIGLFLGRWLAFGVAWIGAWEWLASTLGWGLGIGAFAFLMRWFKAKDGKIYAHYLMHDYAFTARLWGANPPELEARFDVFRAAIARALVSDVDEVLVVGHSSGAHLAVSILADLLGDFPEGARGKALSFLSLGQVVPMISFLPEANRLRRDLHTLSESDRITWVDVTAPGDGCAFALCDPVAVSGVATEQKRWPLVFSAAFTQTLSPKTWKSLRWRFFRLHFQYLCAFDRPKDYD